MGRISANAGDVIAVSLANGRYGAMCVLDVDEDGALQFVVLDGFWSKLPPKTIAVAPKLIGYPYGKHNLFPGQANVWKGWFRGGLRSGFTFVGRARLTAALRRHASGEGTFVFQNADDFRRRLFEHWRSIYDRKALEAERAAAVARYEAQQARKTAARKAMNSLPRMLRERPFRHWHAHWGLRPVRAVQAAFRAATGELIELGPRATRRQKVAVFHRLVEQLNAIDDREGCIETGEREELVARIEELGGLVGLRNTDERLTGRREW
jgi:hypothetical protein